MKLPPALLALAALVAMPAARADTPFPECAPAGSAAVAGAPGCMRVESAALGGTSAFSYYVPEACAQTPCPVLYLLHGHASTYRQHLDRDPATATWEPGYFEHALTAGPPVDPATDDAPWEYAEPETWVPKPALDAILVGPHGQTVAGGYGPDNLQGFWVNWNPKYANGGTPNGYDGPPPRFEDFVVDELIPAVEAAIPSAGRDRAYRGIIGTALGGFGAVGLGLKHPDVFAAVGSMSGALNFLLTPWADPVDAPVPVAVAPPADVPPAHAPGIVGHPALANFPGDAGIFATVFLGLGDPAGDNAYYRGNMPRDLAMNARARAGDEHVLHLRHTVNDAIARRPQDLGPRFPTDQAFEDLMLAMNLSQEAAYTTQGVPRHFQVNPGLHSDVYRWPWLRGFLEGFLANLGDGAPPAPERFDHRSIASDFDVWGWHVTVERATVEFLELRDVSCDGVMRVRGTGVVTIEVRSATCPEMGFDTDGDGSADVVPVDGVLRATLDLGPSQATDEPGGVGAVPAYGRTARLGVVPLHGP